VSVPSLAVAIAAALSVTKVLIDAFSKGLPIKSHSPDPTILT
jgi:hypothetical protein